MTQEIHVDDFVDSRITSIVFSFNYIYFRYQFNVEFFFYTF